jgi:protein-disulfide isomerase
MGRKKITKESLKETPQTNAAMVAPRSIYEIIGKDTFPYEEKTFEDYQKKLEKLDFADLQSHAIAVANILPNIDKRERLIDKLEREYLKKQFAFVGSEGHYQNPQTTPEISALLKRGR